MLTNKKVIGAKTETTQGTLVALVATDFIHAYEPDLNPDIELLDRPYASSSLDPFSQIPGKKFYTVKCKVDLKGSGSAGVAIAPLSAFLQACGFTETIVVSTSVSYDPSSNPATSFYGPGKSCTVKMYEDGSAALSGLLHQVAGVIGNGKLMIEAGKIPTLEFDGKGMHQAVTDAVVPTNTPDSSDPPVVKSATFSSHGLALTISKLELDFGNTVTEKPDANSATSILGFQITARKPVGSCDPEATLVATHDFYGKVAAGTLGALSIVIGSGVGKVITITCPKVQYGVIGKQDRGGIYAFNVPLIFSRNSGDDFLDITIS